MNYITCTRDEVKVHKQRKASSIRQALFSFLFQGNLLLLGGFGNLRGNVEIWSEAGKERREVAKFDAPDSTDVRWSPSGKFLMTSTCAPRLRVGNGFRIWHYSRHVCNFIFFMP